MDDKKMCKDGECGGCSGWCDHHLAGPGRHDLARMLLTICILFFVFWIGLVVGELKAYLKDARLNSYSGYPMMGEGSTWNGYSRMMRGQDAPVSDTAQASPSPSPTMKKGASANY